MAAEGPELAGVGSNAGGAGGQGLESSHENSGGGSPGDNVLQEGGGAGAKSVVDGEGEGFADPYAPEAEELRRQLCRRRSMERAERKQKDKERQVSASDSEDSQRRREGGVRGGEGSEGVKDGEAEERREQRSRRSSKKHRGSLTPGERDMNWVWYWNYPTDAELAPLLTDTAGQRHSDALPGDKLRPEVWEQQKEHARAHLPPQFAQLVALTRQPFVQTIGDLAVPAMAHGHVALVGEAAFVPRPHTAASADQAFGNALGLAEAMSSVAPSAVPSALKRWEAEQMQYGQYLQELGQTLGNRSQFGDPRQVLDLSKLKKPGEGG